MPSSNSTQTFSYYSKLCENGHAIRNSSDFVNKIKHLEVPPGRKMVSFDVSALFTSIPIDYALMAAKQKLSCDPSWQAVTELNLEQILTLLEFCLSTTYFVYQSRFYKQKFGAPMGSPISPGIADLSMEIFEESMLRDCPQHLTPDVWYRYVDDTFSVLHEYFIEEFSDYLNSRNPHIQFTREVEEDGKIAFLDTCVHLLEDGALKTTVFRKPTHTDQYLNWHSNHPLDHKRSVVRTLINRASTLISDPVDQGQEITHIKEVLSANGYPDWIIDVPSQSDATKRKDRKKGSSPSTPSVPVGLPYVAGLSEELQRVFRNHGVSVYHKPFNSLRSLLVKPKDKQKKENKCGTIYHVSCGTCDDHYVGETARALGKRFREHRWSDDQSAVLEHLKSSGHSLSFDDMRVLASETNYSARKIREALEIYKAKPSLNRDQGFEVAPVLLQLLPRPGPDRQPRDLQRASSKHRTSSL